MLRPAVSRLRQELALAILLIAPALAHAEVSDKEPTLIAIWSIGVIAAILCVLAAYYRRWLSLLIAILPILWFVDLLIEMHFSDIGATLYREQGASYYVQTYLALAVLIGGVVVGWRRSPRPQRSVG